MIKRVKNVASGLNRLEVYDALFFPCKLSNSPFQMDHGACPFKFMMDATQLTLSWQLKCENNRPTKSNCI